MTPEQTKLADTVSAQIGQPAPGCDSQYDDQQTQRLQTVSDWLKAVYDKLDERRLALLEPRFL